jgi:Glycine transporter/Sodium/hydrogen exchanger family
MDPALRYATEFFIPPILDLIAIILFAITGALSAAKRGYDWIGAMAIALLTGCGGGLIRDVLLNVRPVFLEHEAYIWAVLAAVLLSIYVFPLVARMRWIFLVADALGLAMYAVIGTQKSLNTGLGISAAILIRHAQRNRQRASPKYSHPGGSGPAEAGAMVRGDCTRWQCALLSPEPSLACAPRRRRDPRRSHAFAARILAHRYDLQTRAVRPVGFDCVCATLLELCRFVANSFVFLFLGIGEHTFLTRLRGEGAAELPYIACAIVAVIVARLIVVYGVIGLVNTSSRIEPIDWRHRAIIFWGGGLRGALPLVLVLSLPFDFVERQRILDLTAGGRAVHPARPRDDGRSSDPFPRTDVRQSDLPPLIPPPGADPPVRANSDRNGEGPGGRRRNRTFNLPFEERLGSTISCLASSRPARIRVLP